MHISAKKQLIVTARTLLFSGMFLLLLFALAHAFTIESVSIVRANSEKHFTLTPTSATIIADGTSTQVLTMAVINVGFDTITIGIDGGTTVTNTTDWSAVGAVVTITKLSGDGTIAPVIYHGNGIYKATVTSPKTSGSGVFVATLTTPTYSEKSEATVIYRAGRATKCVLTTQPEGAVNGEALRIQPIVQLQDENGNNVSDSGVSVVATITKGSGVLTNATAITDGNGTARFTNLSITGRAGNFVLTFTPIDLAAAISNPLALITSHLVPFDPVFPPPYVPPIVPIPPDPVLDIIVPRIEPHESFPTCTAETVTQIVDETTADAPGSAITSKSEAPCTTAKRGMQAMKLTAEKKAPYPIPSRPLPPSSGQLIKVLLSGGFIIIIGAGILLWLRMQQTSSKNTHSKQARIYAQIDYGRQNTNLELLVPKTVTGKREASICLLSDKGTQEIQTQEPLVKSE